MSEEAKKISLANLAGGAVVEAFDHELGRVIENIKDVNTHPMAAREIILKIKFKPMDEDRGLGKVEVHCHAKLAPAKPLAAKVYFAQLRGEFIGLEQDPNQPKLPMGEPIKLKVIGGEKE